MDQAAPLRERLGAFEGMWTGMETLSATPWAAGGTAQGRWAFRLDPSGRYLIQDYHEDRQGGGTFDGHGVLAPAEDGNGYLWFWFDSLGYLPTAPGRGQWDGGALTLIRTSARGANHSVFRLGGDRFTYEVAFIAAGQESAMPVMHGSFARQAR